MGFALGGFLLADVAAEGAADVGIAAAADLGAGAAADIGAGVAADVGAGAAADIGAAGAADAGAAGALGADAGALAPAAADFSALGAEGAAGAQGADIGALGAVSTPSAAPAGGLGGVASQAVPATGGVVSPTGALDLGSQDVLSQAGGDLLGGSDPAALPANSQPASAFAGDSPGVGYNTPGVPASFTGEAPVSGIEGGVGPTGQAGGFLDTTQLPGQSLDFSQAAAGGDALNAGGAQTALAPQNDLSFGPGSQMTTAPTTGTTGMEGATFAGATPETAAPTATAPAAASPAAPATAAATPAAANAGGGAFGGTGWGWKAAGLALGAAPLALTLAKGEAPLPPQAGQVSSIAAQQQAAAQPFINSVIANSPTLTQAAQLQQQQDQLTNQWRQVLFNQGVQNPEADSRWPQIQAQIQQQMQIQTQQMIQSNLQAALGFSGAASNSLLQVANLQVQQDTAFTNAIAGATKALGTVATLGAISGKT